MSELEALKELIENQRQLIKNQQQIIAQHEKTIAELMEPFNGCSACAFSDDGQMCYDCFYGPNHD